MKIKYLLFLIFMLAAPVFAIEKINPDPVAAKLVDEFMTALSIADESTRLQSVLPLIHDSLKSPDKKDVSADAKRFSYKKAVDGVKFYKIPAELGEVHKGNVSTVGFKETAERGRKDKYFVKKKDGVAGYPAPLHVFFPESGNAPKIIDFGSL